jgi:hypothetical protein
MMSLSLVVMVMMMPNGNRRCSRWRTKQLVVNRLAFDSVAAQDSQQQYCTKNPPEASHNIISTKSRKSVIISTAQPVRH